MTANDNLHTDTNLMKRESTSNAQRQEEEAHTPLIECCNTRIFIAALSVIHERVCAFFSSIGFRHERVFSMAVHFVVLFFHFFFFGFCSFVFFHCFLSPAARYSYLHPKKTFF